MHDYSDFGINLNGKSGIEVSTTCPECSSERSKSRAPCLRVNTVKQTWFCHHCGWKGGLGQGLHHAIPAGRPRIVYDHNQTRDPRLIEWFHRRGISEEVIAAHAIGLTTRYFAATGEVDAIAFPYTQGGEVCNVKYRSLEGKHFTQEKGGLKVLYGIDGLAAATTGIIVEGELDCLSLEQAGIAGGLSVPDGAPSTGSKSTDLKFEYLQNCKAQLDRLTKIIIAVDNDGPGKTLEAELIRRLGPDRCWRVTWPEGCKDANDVLLKHGADELRRCVDAAKRLPIEGVVYGADIVDEVLDLFRNGVTHGVSTGIAGMDRCYKPRPGEWTTIMGIPGRGKTTFVETMMVNMAKVHGWSFAVCSPESWPIKRHAAKFIAKYIGLPFYWKEGFRMTEQQALEGHQWFSDHFFSIAPKEMVSIDAVLKKARELVKTNGIRGLLIDPWNAFMHLKPRGEREDEYLAQVLGKVLDFSRDCEVHTWIVCHPHAMEKDKRTGQYPVICQYDINGGAMFANKTFAMLSIHRPDAGAPGYTEIHVQKIKDWGETGYPGMVGLMLDPITGQYSVAQHTIN